VNRKHATAGAAIEPILSYRLSYSFSLQQTSWMDGCFWVGCSLLPRYSLQAFAVVTPQRSEDSNLQMRLTAFSGTPIRSGIFPEPVDSFASSCPLSGLFSSSAEI
jgi:hypothetical protein